VFRIVTELRRIRRPRWADKIGFIVIGAVIVGCAIMYFVGGGAAPQPPR
jgi:hypothetical protein